jgi:hypothetical protein
LAEKITIVQNEKSYECSTELNFECSTIAIRGNLLYLIWNNAKPGIQVAEPFHVGIRLVPGQTAAISELIKKELNRLPEPKKPEGYT